MNRIQTKGSPGETLSPRAGGAAAGCRSARRPGGKLHRVDKTLISGRGCLDYQRYSGAAVGEGEQRPLGLHSPAESTRHEGG